MFKDIRRKITVFNVLTLIVFLLLFIILISLLLTWSLRSSGQNFLVTIANQVIAEDESLQAQEGVFNTKVIHDKIGYNYIEWNHSNQVADIRSNDSNLIREGYELLRDGGYEGGFRTLQVDGVDYRVYQEKFQRNDGTDRTVQVFQEITTEHSVITYTISLIIFIGLGGILMLIPISYFLAGKSIQPIKETFEDQKKFIADASHELRTPLTVIQSNVEVLKMKEGQILEEDDKWLGNIASECDTMARLISELLLIAQADYKKVVLIKEVFDLSALCVEVYDLMYELAKDKDIKLKCDIIENVEYRGDEEKIKQAMRILIDNAIKYTPGGGEVKLSLRDGKRHMYIAVSDTGIGLSEDAKRKIFSRFYRVDDARNREKGGLGLGLNIADMIVKQHGGTIKIDSEEEKGSTFTIVLPKAII